MRILINNKLATEKMQETQQKLVNIVTKPQHFVLEKLFECEIMILFY